MEFKKILEKLKYSNKFSRSLLTKEIIINIQHFNKNELVHILELLQDTADMEYQVKLISIVTAYLLFNNSCRDVIIKMTAVFDTVSKILARGLPLKTATTLNFITSLLHTEDDGGSRSRTLTLHAQNLIRNSGCLMAMTHLFTNYMLHTETWQALCRCLADVCRGSELNQNFCSHLVPLSIQRCLQGNLDVLPLLQSLLFNHKHNTNLFMETNGASIFDREVDIRNIFLLCDDFRKDYLRLQACLELLNTVIHNAELEAINTMANNCRIRENLQIVVKKNNPNLSVVQWATIVLYYLDSKLRENDKCYNATTTNIQQSTLHVDSNVNDTQILLQNIMTEILSYPSKTRGQIPFNNLSKVPNKLANKRDISRIVKTRSPDERSIFGKKLAPRLDYNLSRNEKLSFSFLMNDNLKYDQPSLYDIKSNYQNRKINLTVLDDKKNTSNRESDEYDKLCDSSKTFNSKCLNMTDFRPTFVSTPKKLVSKMPSLTKNTSSKKSLLELSNKSRVIDRTNMKNMPKKTGSQEKNSIQHKSMSSRLFDVINESCTTVIRSFKNVFTGNKSSNAPRQSTANMNSVKSENLNSYCSFSFTNYMQRREAEFMECNRNDEVSSEMDTLNAVNICNTCEDTFLLQQKFASDEHLKSTVKKLKLGINLYGCDFKRISKTMWPRESYMTPNVLYNLYRKLLLK